MTDEKPAATGRSESSIEIFAPPSRVWEVVSDVRNAPRWSSQAVKVFASGSSTEVGTRALNINKQGFIFWPTTSQVVEFEPERRFANRIGGHNTVWSFDLEPTPSGGTLLTERSTFPAALVSLAGFFRNDRSHTHAEASSTERDRPSRSLRRIKKLAEKL